MSFKALPGIIAAALSLAAASPALADTAMFRFDDLDLTSPAGQAKFNARIDATARKACPVVEVTGTRIPRNEERAACLAGARRQIVERLAAQGIRTPQAG